MSAGFAAPAGDIANSRQFVPLGPGESSGFLARSSEWLNLLHYRRLTWTGFQSEIDSRDFFLAPTGRRDPQAELEATWLAIQSQGKTKSESPGGIESKSPAKIENENRTAKKHEILCQYPARAEFFARHLNSPLDLSICRDLQDWLKSLKIHSVSVVFTAPYFGSPASLFGHTFLKLNPSVVLANSLDPLAQVISYEAVTGDSSGAGYAVQGVLGLFPGMYSQQPYFVRTNLYTNIESRDIWEYELKLSPAEISRLLYHLWELRHVYIDYYFFDENCSYNLLPLLEVARPGLQLRSQFYFKAVPLDTARAITKEFTVESVHYRPSLMNQFNSRFEKLRADEKSLVERWVRGDRGFLKQAQNATPTQAASSPPQTVTLPAQTEITSTFSAELLDTLIDYEKYSTFKDAQTLADRSREINHDLLVARSRVGVRAVTTETPAATVAVTASTKKATAVTATPFDPINGHRSTKFSLAFGHAKHRDYIGFGARGVLHDKLDPESGHLGRSTLQVLEPQFRWYEHKDLPQLDEFTFAAVETLAPSDYFETRAAWRIGARVTNPERLACRSCLAGEIDAGYGYAFSHIYFLARGRVQHANAYKFGASSSAYSGKTARDDGTDHWQVDSGPEVGTIYNWRDRLRLFASFSRLYDIEDWSRDHRDYSKWSASLSYTLYSHEVRCEWSQLDFAKQAPAENSARCQYAIYY